MIAKHFAVTGLLTFGIGVVCLLPSSGLPSVGLFSSLHPDKVLHFLMFAALIVSAIVSFKKQPNRRIRAGAIFIAVIVTATYGMLLEAAQIWLDVGRSGEWQDVAANVSGSLVGVLVFKLIYGKECSAAESI
jgi:VanZ family protein